MLPLPPFANLKEEGLNHAGQHAPETTFTG
jgi:hypothetical protein